MLSEMVQSKGDSGRSPNGSRASAEGARLSSTPMDGVRDATVPLRNAMSVGNESAAGNAGLGHGPYSWLSTITRAILFDLEFCSKIAYVFSAGESVDRVCTTGIHLRQQGGDVVSEFPIFSCSGAVQRHGFRLVVFALACRQLLRL